MKNSRKAKAGAVSPAITGGEKFEAEAAGVIDPAYERLVPHEVSVSPAWSRHATPDTMFHRRAFERSFHFAVAVELEPGARDAGGVWLVHGEFMAWRRHAWVELPGGVVFDGVSQRFYDRGGYYKAVFASPWYMYSPTAALLISVRMTPNPDGTILLGNWHQLLGLPWADPENPTRVSDEEVIPLLEKSGLMPPPRPVRGRRKSRPVERP